MNKPRYNFEKIDKAFVETEFQLSRMKDHPVLSRWEKADLPDAIDAKFETINQQRALLEDRLEDVNEETLKMSFISLILNLVQFNGANYTAFADEKLEAEFDNFILTGRVDWFVAKGKYKPETPYLFLQEYKRTKRAESDPEGQLLAEMLVARKLNDTIEPMKGVSITGKFWNFVILHEDQYCISKSYDSTQEDELRDIYRILKIAKNEIAAKFA
jgi:hypothetical protein